MKEMNSRDRERGAAILAVLEEARDATQAVLDAVRRLDALAPKIKLADEAAVKFAARRDAAELRALRTRLLPREKKTAPEKTVRKHSTLRGGSDA